MTAVKYLGLIVGCVVLLTSCRSAGSNDDPNTYIEPEYPEKIHRTVNRISKDILLGNVMAVDVVDSLVIIRGRNVDNDNVFHAVSLRDGIVIKSFCNYGRGDKELTNYLCTAINPERTHMTCVETGKILDIDIAGAITGKTDFITESAAAGVRNTTLSIIDLGDGILHVEGGDSRFFITDKAMADTTARYNVYPQIAKDSDPQADKAYFGINSHPVATPDRSRFAIVTHYGMILEIFRIKDHQIEPIVIRRFYQPRLKNEIFPAEDCIWGATGIYATDKFIYVVYYETAKPNNSMRRMGVFDWKGKEICVYDFDCTIRQFAVTPDDSRVYCWTQNEEGEEYLGYFDLEH